jgi:hypothetical protein
MFTDFIHKILNIGFAIGVFSRWPPVPGNGGGGHGGFFITMTVLFLKGFGVRGHEAGSFFLFTSGYYVIKVGNPES